MLRKSATLEGVPTKDGMITPAISFDLENLDDAKAALVAAGYSQRQAVVAVSTFIISYRSRAEKCIGHFFNCQAEEPQNEKIDIKRGDFHAKRPAF